MSMTDRELIELAAKATGIEIMGFISCYAGPTAERADGGWFDPFDNDSDAIQLALSLGLCVQVIPSCDTVQVYQEREGTGEIYNVHVAALGDIELRRCIVLAAAEIGKAMQEKK